MKAGKITAKLRDAVPVCFMVEGKEVKQYRNIDLHDELKELEIKDFRFEVPVDGKITSKLIFDKGILPAVFPPERPKMTRAEKAATKETAANVLATLIPVTPTPSKDSSPTTPAKTGKSGATAMNIPKDTNAAPAATTPAVVSATPAKGNKPAKSNP